MTTVHDPVAAVEPIRPDARPFIGGEHVDPASDRLIEDRAPATGAVVAEVPAGGTEDVDRAVAAAREAFEDGRWRDLPPRRRGQVIARLAELLVEHGDELATLTTVEMGKPIRYSSKVDLVQAETTYRWYGELADKRYDEVSPTGPDALGLITREPVGVVGAITPWNFPLMIDAWKLAPALVAGNSVVLKPAEQSPLVSLRVAELALEAGLPPGVLNVVPGYGEEAGRALALHMDVDAVTFTGSTAVGKLLLEYAGKSNMKRVSLETGGKTPNIIFADAPDLDFALSAVGFAIFWMTGEMCVAGSRLLVQRDVLDAAVDKAKELAASWMPGDPLDPKTKAGPVVEEEALERILGYVDKGVEEGAELVAGGRRVLEETGGWYVEPTVFTGVRNDMTIAQEEIFGPVLAIIPFDDEEEALRIANETRYGLSAAVWTRDLARAHRMARALRAGTVWINNFDQADITAPFGGFKESGFGGKDKGVHALDKYTNLKTTWINLGRGGRST
ncbi:MAG TPA: aldehyde dehydrogenase [Actinobacteria bacterium]|nr:aldehyde dehydrogenase [Actinomycetota bacterium]